MYITEKDKEMYNRIREYILTHGYAPSYREIGEIMGLSSSSSVYNRIHRLFQLKLLYSDHKEGTPRAIRIPGMKIKIPQI